MWDAPSKPLKAQAGFQLLSSCFSQDLHPKIILSNEACSRWGSAECLGEVQLVSDEDSGTECHRQLCSPLTSPKTLHPKLPLFWERQDALPRLLCGDTDLLLHFNHHHQSCSGGRNSSPQGRKTPPFCCCLVLRGPLTISAAGARNAADEPSPYSTTTEPALPLPLLQPGQWGTKKSPHSAVVRGGSFSCWEYHGTMSSSEWAAQTISAGTNRAAKPSSDAVLAPCVTGGKD